MNMYYYQVNYFFGRKDSGSIYFESSKNLDDEDKIIQEGVDLKKIDLADVDNIIDAEQMEKEYYPFGS